MAVSFIILLRERTHSGIGRYWLRVNEGFSHIGALPPRVPILLLLTTIEQYVSSLLARCMCKILCVV